MSFSSGGIGGGGSTPIPRFSAQLDLVAGNNTVTHTLAVTPSGFQVFRATGQPSAGQSVDVREVSRSATTVVLFSPIALTGNIIYIW